MSKVDVLRVTVCDSMLVTRVWCPDFKTISLLVKVQSLVDVFLEYVMSSSLKEPGNLWEPSLLGLLPLGHYVTKLVDLPKYKMKFDQNM